MSEVIVPERTAVAPAPTVSWTPLGENAILVMSACDAMPAKVPVAVDGNPRNRAQTMVLSWRRPGADASAATGFLCLAPAPSADRAGSGALLVGRPGRPVRLLLAPKPLPLEAFLSELAGDAGQAFPSVVDGLLEVLLSGTPNPRRLRAVSMLLQTVARPGGFVEVMGSLEGDGIFMQGWTSHFAAGRVSLLIAHGGLSTAHLEAGTFERDDLGEGARGFFGLLEDCRAQHPGEIERLYFRGNDGWRALEVYERYVLLEPITVPGHLRDGLQRGSAAGDGRQAAPRLAALRWARHGLPARRAGAGRHRRRHHRRRDRRSDHRLAVRSGTQGRCGEPAQRQPVLRHRPALDARAATGRDRGLHGGSALRPGARLAPE